MRLAKLGVAAYAGNLNSFTAQLARYFLEVENEDRRRVEAVRYGKNCDDNANELTSMILDGRLKEFIGTDESVQSLRVFSGKCSLARASVDAVRQWRYQPTLLNGKPVEVDTEIDVIFGLQRCGG